MQITITGRHLGVTEPMKAYARSKVERLLRFFDRTSAAVVTMDVEHGDHEVEIVLEVGRGARLVGKAAAPDMYAAVDLAEHKVAMQLRKTKERLRDHHRSDRRHEHAGPHAGGEGPGALRPDERHPGALPPGAAGSDAPGSDAPGPDAIPTEALTYEEVIERLRNGE